MLFFKSTNKENLGRVNLEQVTCYVPNSNDNKITLWFAGDNENQITFSYKSVDEFKLDLNLLDELVGLKKKES